MSVIGKSINRLEDKRLLLGRGRFHDDVILPGQLWMRVVRSPVAHARIRYINTTRAAQQSGVIRIITAADLPRLLHIPVRQATPGINFTPYLQLPLATEFVRYVGEPVAVIVAEDPWIAEDAATLVTFDFEELPVALDARSSARTQPVSWQGNPAEVGVVDFGYGNVDQAFGSASHVVSANLRIGRHSGTPLEPRGLVAAYDPISERLTIWGATKVPYWNRRVLALMLGISEHQIHMLETDAGGSFGIRGEFYPEDFLVPYLCMLEGRPVKWCEDRHEHMIAANHSREQEHTIELAFDEQYRLVSLRDDVWMDTGAYIRTHGAVVAVLTAAMMSGPYRLPNCRTRVHIVTTNKTPVGTYRAPGRFQLNFVREHILDVAASRLGIDPVELRRRNLLDGTELPHTRPLTVFGSPMILDGKDHKEHFAKSLATVAYDSWREEVWKYRQDGRLVGSGCAFILEKAGLGHDSAVVDVDTTGSVRVAMGGANVGQGIETIMAQIAAEAFDISPDTVKVILSDTDILPDGSGTFASRSTVVGGTAVKMAAEQVLNKAKCIAAKMLQVVPEELSLHKGAIVVQKQPEKRVTLAEIARESFSPAYIHTGSETGLVGRSTYVANGMTYPYGVHYAQVEIERETGKVHLLRYAITYEIGCAINPMLVRGQLLGGAVQGIGGALCEEFRYNERGEPLSVTLNNYAWPRSSGLPEIEIHLFEDSPAPGNPLHARGAGEGGTAGCGGAIANAVRDALQLSSDVGALPLHPERVKMLLRQKEEALNADALNSQSFQE